MAKPTPVPTDLICSECGLDWNDHPKNARRRDCIKLLIEDQSKKVFTIPIDPYVYRVPYRPYDWWYQGTWNNTNITDTITVGDHTKQVSTTESVWSRDTIEANSANLG